MKSRPPGKPPRTNSASPTPTPLPKYPLKPLSRISVTLKRISLLYQELKLRDAHSRYPWRILALAAVVCSFISMFHLLLTTAITVIPATMTLIPGSGLNQRYERMFYNDSDFAFIPESSMMITTTAKAGSTAFWTSLHRGITGLPSFDKCNETYIQNFTAPCWLGKVVHPFNMTQSQRWRMVNRPEILRVAITRDPYERLISAWKSKAACDSDDFGTDVSDRNKIVPIMLRQANISKDMNCVSLQSFARVLDKLRRMSRKGIFNMNDMNKHFRPQQCYFEDIPYDIVLDVSDLRNMTLLAPIVERLRYADLVKGPPARLHASRSSFLMISEQTAATLYRFASLTEAFPPRVGDDLAVDGWETTSPANLTQPTILTN